jgi:SAM-dependent methyltransferase
MSDSPLSWHFGLMAEYWAEFVKDTPQLPFLRAAIQQFGQPVLDVGCGTGRLLLPLLREGVEIDGVDLSADMLAHCRRKAASEGLSADLYAQPMHAYSLPRKYRTIYMIDSFGLGGSRRNDLQALQCAHDHLEDGGALLVNIYASYNDPEDWRKWLKEYRDKLPENWMEQPYIDHTSDGGEIRSWFRTLRVDPLEQYKLMEVRLEKWMQGQRVAEAQYTLRENVYNQSEVLLMLQMAGFREITVSGDYTGEPANTEHNDLVFTAVRSNHG